MELFKVLLVLLNYLYEITPINFKNLREAFTIS